MSAREPALLRGEPLVPTATLGMVLFLVTEAMFFTALASALLVLRAEAAAWPPPGQPRLPVGVTAANTALLLLSGWTVQRAAGAARPRARPEPWLEASAALGALFLAVQGSE
jgi:heme/copper-type cytochrome/quinol oxidase subunit 3